MIWDQGQPQDTQEADNEFEQGYTFQRNFQCLRNDLRNCQVFLS